MGCHSDRTSIRQNLLATFSTKQADVIFPFGHRMLHAAERPRPLQPPRGGLHLLRNSANPWLSSFVFSPLRLDLDPSRRQISLGAFLGSF